MCETQGLAAYKYVTDRVTASYRMTVHPPSVLQVILAGLRSVAGLEPLDLPTLPSKLSAEEEERKISLRERLTETLLLDSRLIIFLLELLTLCIQVTEFSLQGLYLFLDLLLPLFVVSHLALVGLGVGDDLAVGGDEVVGLGVGVLISLVGISIAPVCLRCLVV
jgi:hypothetical protein